MSGRALGGRRICNSRELIGRKQCGLLIKFCAYRPSTKSQDAPTRLPSPSTKLNRASQRTKKDTVKGRLAKEQQVQKVSGLSCAPGKPGKANERLAKQEKKKVARTEVDERHREQEGRRVTRSKTAARAG